MSERVTRSRSRRPADESSKTTPETRSPDRTSPVLTLKSTQNTCKRLTEQQLSKQLSRLPKDDFALLRLKQRKLRSPDAQVPLFIKECESSNSHLLAQAASATLVFAWEAAGTAVCISPEGLLLTCSHCIAESEEEYDPAKERWLLFASGDAVKAKCVAWDPKRDLALLQITAAPDSFTEFPYVRISTSAPKRNARMICIGHPGSEDLEASTAGIATDYDVLHVSEGRFRGLAKGQDVQDNSDIGALMHDCWTYWGHSGAPLVEKESGKLVGLHSSWDDETAMRRGVAWEAIRDFLDEWTALDRVVGR